jgi:hypothetical protein
MEIREQKYQSDIILLWKNLDKEMAMFYKLAVTIKKRSLICSKFYSDSGQRKL